VVDGDSYYSRPGPRLADGVRQLGHLLHPETVPDPGLPLIDIRPAASLVAASAVRGDWNAQGRSGA